ncbi:helix-turn-helix domain-containing protein [Gordonia sp. NPDC003950]
MTLTEAGFYAVLATFADADTGDFWATRTTLAQAAGASLRTVDTHLDALMAKGYLTRTRRGNRSSRYRLRVRDSQDAATPDLQDAATPDLQDAAHITDQGITDQGTDHPPAGAPLRDCTGDRLIPKRFPIISERFPKPIPGVFDLEQTARERPLPRDWQPNRSHWRLIHDLRADHGVLVLPGWVDAVFAAWEAWAMCDHRLSANWGASLRGAIQAIAEHLGGPEVDLDKSGYGAGFQFDVNHGEGEELVDLFEHFCDELRGRHLRAM